MSTIEITSFFEDPGSIRKMMEAGLKLGKEEGELSELEVQQLLEQARPPAFAQGDPPASTEFHPRGEGGSGERAKPVKRPASPGEPAANSDGGGEGVEEGEENQEDMHSEADFKGGDAIAEEGDVGEVASSRGTSLISSEQTAVTELRAYCEDQFASMIQILTPLSARVEVLERKLATSVPTGMAIGRAGGVGPGSPPRHSRVLSGGTHRELQIPRSLNKEVIVEFVRANPKYPSIATVRAAKMRVLQTTLGTERRAVEVRPSEWTPEGLYAVLTEAYKEDS